MAATPNPRRANGSRRDKVRAQVIAEEHACWICSAEVDKSLTVQFGKHGPRCKGDGCPGCVPHEMRAEVDEVLPVSQGGSPYDRANCRLSHRRCNRGRNRTKPVPAATPDDFPITAGIWSRYPWGGSPTPSARALPVA
jgi:5-methylcytosine-specific restriction endonuclease McrA